jgi:ADP-ribose pyrophosphatase
MTKHLDMNVTRSGYEYVSRKNNRGAVVIIPAIKQTMEDGTTQVLLQTIVQHRPTFENKLIEFPAGLIDDGESVEQTAIRELEEETGWRIENHDILCKIKSASSPGLTNEVVHIVLVDISKSTRYSIDDPTRRKDNDSYLIELPELMTSSEILAMALKNDYIISSRMSAFILGGNSFAIWLR